MWPDSIIDRIIPDNCVQPNYRFETNFLGREGEVGRHLDLILVIVYLPFSCLCRMEGVMLLLTGYVTR